MAGRRHRLTAARKAAGLSLEAFAVAVEVHRSTAIRWELGESEPRPRQRPAIARVLGRSLADVDELLRPEDTPEPLQPAGLAPEWFVTAASRLGADSDGDRMRFILRNPRAVDLVAVAELREQIRALDVAYEATPSSLLVGPAGQCLGHVMLLKGYASARVARELSAAEVEAAILVGQLVWDASQRREHGAARLYFQQARTAARQLGDPAGEGMAFLRDSYLALYGEDNPKAGLDSAVQASTVSDPASSVVAGLALLHTAEAYARLGQRRQCERALSDAESHLDQIDNTDPAAELFSPTQPGRLAGSCYLALGDARRAKAILEETADGFSSPSKNQAIVLGNLGLALVHLKEIDDAVTVLNQAVPPPSPEI